MEHGGGMAFGSNVQLPLQNGRKILCVSERFVQFAKDACVGEEREGQVLSITTASGLPCSGTAVNTSTCALCGLREARERSTNRRG